MTRRINGCMMGSYQNEEVQVVVEVLESNNNTWRAMTCDQVPIEVEFKIEGGTLPRLQTTSRNEYAEIIGVCGRQKITVTSPTGVVWLKAPIDNSLVKWTNELWNHVRLQECFQTSV